MKIQQLVACLFVLAGVSISKDILNKMRIIYIQFLHCVALEFVAKMSRDFCLLAAIAAALRNRKYTDSSRIRRAQRHGHSRSR